ncbi:MAG TPA: hypothetical protein VFS08_06310 [Gemmatimonadaceae bacterium]|nr:hypothetical protein [Gemmatimonadaceae bacterium]
MPISFAGRTGRGQRRPTAARRTPAVRALALVVVGLLAGCGGDDPVSPTVDAVAGSYRATTLTATVGGLTTNLLQLGSSLELTLAPDGTATGHLFVPQADEGGRDLDESMTGTWTLRDGVVYLSQPADTFIRDLPLRVDGDLLRGEATYDGARVVAVLERT